MIVILRPRPFLADIVEKVFSALTTQKFSGP